MAKSPAAPADRRGGAAARRHTPRPDAELVPARIALRFRSLTARRLGAAVAVAALLATAAPAARADAGDATIQAIVVAGELPELRWPRFPDYQADARGALRRARLGSALARRRRADGSRARGDRAAARSRRQGPRRARLRRRPDRRARSTAGGAARRIARAGGALRRRAHARADAPRLGPACRPHQSEEPALRLRHRSRGSSISRWTSPTPCTTAASARS